MNMTLLLDAWKTGWPIGLVLFFFAELAPAIHSHQYDAKALALGFILWSFGGMYAGYVIQKTRRKKKFDD